MKHLLTGSFVKNALTFFAIIVEGLLVLRVALQLIMANPASPFVVWVNEFTYPLVYPFLNMLSNHIPGFEFEIELSTIFAMVIYALIGYLLLYFVTILEKPKKKY